MFGFALKSTMFYMLWNKFKSQLITMIVSIILIAIIFSVYEDLYKVLKISSKESVAILFLLKWFLVFIILGYNWFSFRRLKVKPIQDTPKNNSINFIFEDTKEEVKTKPSNKHYADILHKKKLKTKSDVILQKYLDKKR